MYRNLFALFDYIIMRTHHQSLYQHQKIRQSKDRGVGYLLELYSNNFLMIDIKEYDMIDLQHIIHVIVAEENRKIVSSCVCVIIPNLTHNQQPYAFIENVITDEKYRNKGLATQCLDYAREIAIKKIIIK